MSSILFKIVFGALICFLIFILSAMIGGQPLGERTIVGPVSGVRVAPATFPPKVGVTLYDGPDVILEQDTVIDTNQSYKTVVKETKHWWGIYSDVKEFIPVNGGRKLDEAG